MIKKLILIIVIFLVILIKRIMSNPELIEELQQYIENGMKK